jgi:hypothetical protein
MLTQVSSLLLLLVRALGVSNSLPLVLLNILEPTFAGKSSIDALELASALCSHSSTKDHLHALSQLADACQKMPAASDGAKRTRILAFLLSNLESPKLAAHIDSAHAKENHAFDNTLSAILKTMIMARSQAEENKADYTAIIAACTKLLSPLVFAQSVMWLYSLGQDEASLEAFTLLQQKTAHLKPFHRPVLLSAIGAAYGKSMDFANVAKAVSQPRVARTIAQLAQGAMPDEHSALAMVFERYLSLPEHSSEVLDMLSAIECVRAAFLRKFTDRIKQARSWSSSDVFRSQGRRCCEPVPQRP